MAARQTLLCVDDEPNVLEVLARMFEKRFEVICATSGAQALEVLKTRVVDLLITDQKMPGMTGIELARNARQAGLDIPTILLTAYTNPTDLIAAINEGQVYRYVTKPWDVNDLMMTVRNALEARSLKVEKEKLLESLRKRIEALNVMYDVSRQSANEAWSLEGIVDRLLATVGRVLPHECSAVLIEAGEGKRSASLRLRSYAALSEQALLTVKESVLTSHRKAAGVLLTEDRVITNVSGQVVSPSGGLPAFACSLSVPLVSGGQTVGTLSLFSSKPDAYSTEDGELLDLLVNHTTDAITHVRAAERDARLRLEQMVETMGDGVVLADEQGDVVVINGAARALLQIPVSEGRVTLQRLNGELGLSPFDIVRGWEYSGKRTFREDLKLQDRHVTLVVAPVVDPSRKLRGVLVVLHDVTEQRLLEERKEEFVGIVSHELRTPLTSITGAVDLVLGNMAGEVNERQRHFLKMARESADKLHAMVDDLLDLTRLARGRMRMAFEFTHLDQLARAAVEKYSAALGEKGLVATVEAPLPVSVLADPGRITQVLNNLLSNALKFAPPKGEVRVSVRGTLSAPGQVALSVWNSGEPIPEVSLERIFDRFEQARTAKNRNVPGTGLGLSISRSIVEGHGGQLWAEACDDGARFVAVLPMEPPQAALDGEEAPVAPQRKGEPRGTVLVVEDEPELGFTLKAMLLGGGYRVVIAQSGDQALTQARKHQPDLIVLDQRLPDVEGLKLLEIFKHDPDTHHARVLMTSGLDLRNEALQRGAGFVLKPIGKDKLLAAVEGALSQRGRGRGRILVVDDDPNIASVCAEVLVNQGFEVDRAGTLGEARARVNDNRPDLLLLDVMLPDGDGLSFFESLKAERASSPLSVIFISARADTSAKVRALKLGGDDYLTKPFDALELGARVESVLQRRSTNAQASPTTQLPGSVAIEREVQRRVAARQPFAFCYLDLDNLKGYNDYYGFAKADGVVRQTGDLLREVFARHGGPEDFLGHVAGDDFVFMTTPELVDELCLQLIDGFDRIIPLYYDRSDRERGYIEGEDRFGERRKFPIMTVSIVAVLTDGSGSHAELARRAAELKLKAKAIRGSVFLRNDRSEPVRALKQGA